MRIGIVGYQGSGKTTIFELLTGVQPDVSKAHTGQVGVAIVPDERFDRLVELYQPKKETPARIELFDTPGLSPGEQKQNAQRLGIIRDSATLVLVVNAFSNADPAADVQSFLDELVLADLQVVSGRISRLEKDSTKPVPNRDELKAELESLRPIEQRLADGQSVAGMEFDETQEKATRSFSLLTRKKLLVLVNTSDSEPDAAMIAAVEKLGHPMVAGPLGLELEVAQLPEEDREEFAAEMGLGESSRRRVLQAIFELTDYITFFTCDEKEVHAWLIHRGSTALDAAGAIHTDLARGFIRAEVMSVDDLLRLGSEREVKSAGLQHLEGKEYVVQDGDELVIRFSV